MANLQAQKMWKSLSKVALDENYCLKEPWHIFKEGTKIEEIWSWFEDVFNVSIKEGLMEGIDEEVIEIIISDGGILDISNPSGCKIIIKDYDIDPTDAQERDDCEQDKHGSWYQKLTFN